MKTLFLILVAFISFNSFSQTTKFIRTDTLKGADTLYFTTNQLKSPNGFIGIEASCEQITGSSINDYIIAQASQSGNTDGFATLNTVAYKVYAAQNDTVSIDEVLLVYRVYLDYHLITLGLWL